MSVRSILVAVLLAFAMPALADSAGQAEVPTVNNLSVEQFLAFHDEVARKSRSGELESLSNSDLDALATAQSALRRALDGKSEMSQLDDAGKLVVFNAHEKVVALVNKAEDERLVCEQVKRLGSHRHTLVCRTVAQTRSERERARMNRLRLPACDPKYDRCG